MPSKDNGFVAVNVRRRVCAGGCPHTGLSVTGLYAALRGRVRLVRRGVVRLFKGESGTATVEFALVFPILMFLILILVQATLLMVGNQFVHYAAFAAARSAITYIPADFSGDGEPRNRIIPGEGSPKYQAIRASAYFAVMPVCGRLEENSNVSTDTFVDGLRDYFTSYEQDAPKWVDALAADRLRYAEANTTVEVMETEVFERAIDYFPIDSGSSYTFGPRDAITVRIEHRLNLSVPYVRGIFADGDHPDGRGKYALVTAQYTLTNEGVLTDLPDRPTPPRDPR